MLEDAGRQADVVILEEFHPIVSCPSMLMHMYLQHARALPLMIIFATQAPSHAGRGGDHVGRRRWDEYRMDAILGEDAGPRKDSSM